MSSALNTNGTEQPNGALIRHVTLIQQERTVKRQGNHDASGEQQPNLIGADGYQERCHHR